jgi:hypothetical protein
MLLPYLNFGVAVSALSFQLFVLEPWHHDLDREFKILKQEHKETLAMYHDIKLRRLEELEKRIIGVEADAGSTPSRGSAAVSEVCT